MARTNPSQLAFNAGVFGAEVQSRLDLPIYARGADVMSNFFPLVEGPAEKRPGTKRCGPVKAKHADKTAVLVPYNESLSQKYQLEFGDLYMRVWPSVGHGPLLDVLDSAGAGTAATNPMRVDVGGAHNLTTGDTIKLVENPAFLPFPFPTLEDRFFEITVVDPNTFTIDGVDATGLGVSAADFVAWQKITEIVSPITEAVLEGLDWEQSGNALYIASGQIPIKVERSTAGVWSITQLTFTFDHEPVVTSEDPIQFPPFQPLASVSRTVAPISVYGDAQIVTRFTSDAPLFAATDVGRYFTLVQLSILSGYALITGFVDDMNVDVDCFVQIGPGSVGVGNKDANWAFNAFSTIDGFPTSVLIFQNRLWWAGTTTQPKTFWGSRVDDFENYITYNPYVSPNAVTDADGLSFTIESDTNDAIEWMTGIDDFFIGTAGGEWTIRAASDREAPVTAGDISVKRRSSYGSRPGRRPASIDSIVMFIQRAGKKLREFSFKFEVDRYTAPNMTRLARELVVEGISQVRFQKEPNRVLWVLLDDGSLVTFTYEPEETVLAWSVQVIGGAGLEIESISVNPSTSDTTDEIMMVVRRTVNGQIERGVELLDSFWDRSRAPADAVFLDSAVLYSDPATSITVLEGLDHLVGETVGVYIDGVVHPQQVVGGPTLTLPVAGNTVTVGLPYSSRLRTLEWEGPARLGITQGRTKRIHGLIMRLIQCGEGIEFGGDFTDMDVLEARELGLDDSDPVPLFDGDTTELDMPSGYEEGGHVAIRHDRPTPCAVAGLFAKMETEED